MTTHPLLLALLAACLASPAAHAADSTAPLAPSPAIAAPPPGPSPAVAKPTDPPARRMPPTLAMADNGNGPGLPNPSIDMASYLRVSAEAAAYRQSHRLSEEDFLRMSREPGTVVLDARSAEKYRLLHVHGAINLSFPDITVESLGRVLPDKSTLVLIYCNNNFTGAQKAFPTKLPSASLNLSTYVALYTYGYRNVYELGPTVDLKASKLAFDGTE